MKKNIIIFELFLLITIWCKTSKINIDHLPKQAEINNSDMYYDILNKVFLYEDKINRIYSNKETGQKQVTIYQKVEVPTWNCFTYQKKNMIYYDSYIDTSYIPVDTKISIEKLEKVCEALYSTFELSENKSKYVFNVIFETKPKEELSWGSASVFSPVIDRLDGTYEVYSSTYDFEGGVGTIFIIDYIDGEFSVKTHLDDAMDQFGCWYEDDYVSKLCEKKIK